jgi:hypothetical protein
MYCGTGVQARSASCRGPHGSTGMQGGLRRGAHGTVLLGRACYGRAWCIGEGMQEGHALMCFPGPTAYSSPGPKRKRTGRLPPAGRPGAWIGPSPRKPSRAGSQKASEARPSHGLGPGGGGVAMAMAMAMAMEVAPICACGGHQPRPPAPGKGKRQRSQAGSGLRVLNVGPVGSELGPGDLSCRHRRGRAGGLGPDLFRLGQGKGNSQSPQKA